MNLARAFATVGGWTMASRILGFVRDILIARYLGAGPVADAFFVAFKFPNFFRRLFGEGAFNAAFVPLFAGRLEQDGRAEALAFARRVVGVLGTFLVVFTVAAEVAMPWLMLAIAPGFADDPDKFALAVDLTRITFPYLGCMSIAALLSGMLNSLNRFAAPAAAPVLLNVVLIAAMVVVAPVMATVGHALAWGVFVAGFVQVIWLVLACARLGMVPWPRRPRLDPGVRRLIRLMVPGLIGAGVVQINLVVDTILATLLPGGAVSYLYYADRLNQLPLGVIGVAIGVALLPMLTRQLRAGDLDAARDSQNRAIEFALLLTLPAAAALATIPGELVTVLFQRGAFDAGDSTQTAWTLQAFAVGLPAFVLIKALQPGFFAREDTASPVKVAAVAMAVNIALAVALMTWLRQYGIGQVGIALATSLTSWLNAGALAWWLRRRGHFAVDARLRRRLPRIVLATALMAAALWGGARLAAPFLAGPAWEKIPALAALVAGGLAVYFGVGAMLGVARPADLKGMVRRRKT